MPAKTFTYKHKGKTIKCPSIANPTVGVLRKLRKIPESEQAFFICEEFLDAATLDVVDSMSPEEFVKFMEAWGAGDTTPGE